MYITILISLYKEPLGWIKETFYSLEKQSIDCSLYSYVIINDCPQRSDEIRSLLNEVIHDYKSRVKYLSNKENIGLTKSLNKGLQFCNTKYVARMDADDICYPERLLKQYNILEKNESVDICFGKMTYIDEFSRVLHDAWVPNSLSVILKNIEKRNFIPHPSVMFRRASFEYSDIKYNEEYKTAQDQALWIICRDKGMQFYFIGEPLVYYRLNSSSVSMKKFGVYQKRLINSALFNGNTKLARDLISNEHQPFSLSLFLKLYIPKKIRFLVNSFQFR